MKRSWIGRWAGVCVLAAAWVPAQADSLFRPSGGYLGEEVPQDIDRMVKRGLQYLQREQRPDGSWANSGGEAGPAITAFCVLSMLASGEDARFGLYAPNIKRGIQSILAAQDGQGYIGPSMYNHGFATLALAEAYGMVDEPRIGPALEKAVNLIVDAQTRSRSGAWRYSPTSDDADTTVSGAQMVALFAARNAGIAVENEVLDRALNFYRQCLTSDGGVGYTDANAGGSGPRNAIAVLVAGLAREQNSKLFRSAWQWLQQRGEGDEDGGAYTFYYLYYAAQAYFRADMNAWRKWNRKTADALSMTQSASGAWEGPNGTTFCTGASILSMALNYRFLPIYER